LCVGRVIARPFIGEPGNFKRTTNRKDYSLDPPEDTILDILQRNRINTVAIGKINDLFNFRGIQISEKTKSNIDGCNKLLQYASNVKDSFIFSNLVDFDVDFGHRNDPVGFANALKEFDDFLKIFLEVLDPNDRLVITADHGNDPTTPSTDHAGSMYLVILENKRSFDLGERSTFSDVGKTAADFLMFKILERNSF
jgi:phosphopentomutase